MVSIIGYPLPPHREFSSTKKITSWMGVSLSLGLRQSVAPSCLASSNLDALVSIAKILDAFLAFAACRKGCGSTEYESKGRAWAIGETGIYHRESAAFVVAL